MTLRPFRFGVVAAMARSGEEWLAKARRVESLGYATLLMPDGLRYSLAPLPALAAAAAATQSLRVGTYVMANDFRHPALLAKDAATLDFLCGGRFELGIGAGRPGAADDNRLLGLSFDRGSVRLTRLAESLGTLKRLMAADSEISPHPVQQPHPPILIAASGQKMLELAAREADIVALGVPPTVTQPELQERLDWLRAAAGDRFDQIELNVNLMAVGDQVPRYVATQLGLTAEGLARGGSLAALTGTPAEMCATLVQRRAALGISYIVVSDELMEAFAPVVAELAGR